MKNLYLIGMMGAGKSYWGEQLSRQLGRPWVDLDVYITDRTGLTPADWIRQHGEPAFREVERLALQEVSRLEATIVATGGGAPLLDEAATWLRDSGEVIWLDAPLSVLWERAQGHEDRPLAREEETFARLYQTRRDWYARLGRRVDTSAPPEQVWPALVGELTPLGPNELAPDLVISSSAGKYPVKQLSSLVEAALWLKQHLSPPFLIVAPPLVYSLYGRPLEAALGGDALPGCIIPDGEEHKTLATVEQLYQRFLAASLHRASTILALGGGVTGDLVGFAAATFLRGVPLVQLPTTLLAQVDSAVGGKVAVNLPQGKNLVGTFYPPRAALLITPTLHSLPAHVYRQGLAEIVKCALLTGEEALAWLEAQAQALRLRSPLVMHRAIYAANALKKRLVDADERDLGVRHYLNLGHTLAHALEASHQYRGLGHGDAVAYGLQWALSLSPARELLPRVQRLLSQLGFQLRMPPLDADEVLSYLSYDKKRGRGGLSLVLLDAPGRARTSSQWEADELRQALTMLMERPGDQSCG